MLRGDARRGSLHYVTVPAAHFERALYRISRLLSSASNRVVFNPERPLIPMEGPAAKGVKLLLSENGIRTILGSVGALTVFNLVRRCMAAPLAWWYIAAVPLTLSSSLAAAFLGIVGSLSFLYAELFTIHPTLLYRKVLRALAENEEISKRARHPIRPAGTSSASVRLWAPSFLATQPRLNIEFRRARAEILIPLAGAGSPREVLVVRCAVDRRPGLGARYTVTRAELVRSGEPGALELPVGKGGFFFRSRRYI
mmetsp:Transcript_17001/g.43622  ORF Transcript_17001/g.43622 Transcript_17001/m.43622 type:complete len:254 (+) Transcript_17001:121-882(+)